MNLKKMTLYKLPRIRPWLATIALSLGLASGLNAQVDPVVASGLDFTAIVDDAGGLYVFGANSPEGPRIVDPVSSARSWVSVAVAPTDFADAHILAIQDDGSLWAWGNNSRGQLGNDSTVSSLVPVAVDTVYSDWVEVACGVEFSIARRSNGLVYVWGDNSFGQMARAILDQDSFGLGSPTSTRNNFESPVLLNAGDSDPSNDSTTYISIAAGEQNGIAIKSDGSMYSWGYSDSLQLGLEGSLRDVVGPFIIPQRVGSSNSWTKVFSGLEMHFGLQGGRLYTWGYGSYLQSGDFGGHQEPVRIGSFTDWTDIAIGMTHALGLRSGGSLYGWGSNEEGQLGLPSTTLNIRTPTQLQAGESFQAIGAGTSFSVIVAEGSPLDVKTSGINDVGQRGLGLVSPGSDFSFNANEIDFGILYTVDLALSNFALEENPNFPGVDPAQNFVAGESLYFSLDLSNLGSSDLTQNFEIDAILCPVNQYLPSYVGAVNLSFVSLSGTTSVTTITADIETDEVLSLVLRVQLPSSIDPGDYFLVLRGDVGGALSENTALLENNDIASTLLSFAPDLSGQATVATTEFVRGDDILALLAIENVGTFSTTEQFGITAVLSPTNSYDSPDAVPLTVSSGGTITDPIDPKETLNIFATVDIPASATDLPDGCYNLIYRLDAAASLDEAVTSNNDILALDQICFGQEQPDLLLSNLVALELPAFPGVNPTTNLIADGELAVSLDISNLGDGDITTDFSLEAVLSPSTFANDPNAVPLSFLGGEIVTVDIDAGASTSVGVRFRLPTSIENGTYNLIIVGDADASLDEEVVDNNQVLLSGLNFVPDIGISVDVSNENFTVGEEVEATLTVVNTGSWTAVDDFDIEAVLASTPFFDGLSATQINLVGASVNENLDPGESIILECSFTVPTTFSDGAYYLIFRADDARALDEVVINNNDFVVGDLFEVGVDIAPQSIELASFTPTPGGDLSATIFIQNLGSRTLTESFNLKAVLSPETDFDDAGAVGITFDPSITSITVSDDIDSQETISVAVTFDFPANLDQGDYFLVVWVDSGESVIEFDETNNFVSSVTQFELLPDLIFDDATGVFLDLTGITSFDPSDAMDITLNLKNQGLGNIPEGTEFDIRVLLTPTESTDDINAVDIESEFVFVAPVGGFNSSDTLSIPLTGAVLPLGLASGNYFIAAVLDVNEEITEQTELLDTSNGSSREDGEANNIFISSAPLVIVNGIALDEAIDQPGRTFNTSGDATWFGQSAAFSPLGPDSDAVQSPAIAGGQSAIFSTSFATSVAVTFDWFVQTSSSENKLIYRVLGGVVGSNTISEFSGSSTEWATVQLIVPAGSILEWEYQEGVDAEDDAVFIDNLTIAPITEPDLVIDDLILTDQAAVIESGSYVLERDQLYLNVNSRNQGLETGSSSQYAISIYLSKDRVLDRPDSSPTTQDDILIRQAIVSEQILAGTPAVNSFTVDLDSAIEPGDYYLIAYIDDFSDADGVLLPGAAVGDGQIAEYVVGGFPGEDNNAFITADPLVTIVAFPNLVVSDLFSVPEYYQLFEDDGATANTLPLNFTLANTGITSVTNPINVAVVFSRDQEIEPDSDYLLLDYNYTGNFAPLLDAPANEQFISPDSVDFRNDLITEGYIGERLFIGAFVDSADTVTEINEEDNEFFIAKNDFIISELELVEGLDLDPATLANLNIDADTDIINDEVAPYDSSSVPWVGQTTDTFDGVDAIMSVGIGDNETSQFSIDIQPTSGVEISFLWKVSSQNELVEGVQQRDVLRFTVDGTAVVPDIFGTDNTWSRVTVLLPAGAQTLSWQYIKDDEGSQGEDRAWVDSLSITELPNLIVSGITINGSPVYAPGDNITSWSVTIENTGDDIPSGVEFDTALRLLGTDSWSSVDGVNLLTITDSTGLDSEESRTYNFSTDGALTLPDIDYDQEFYFFAAYADFSALDTLTGQLSESSETDNFGVTTTASVQLGRPDIVGDADLIDGVASSYAYQQVVNLDINLVNSGEGVLLNGESFDVTVYLSSSNDVDLDSSSSAFELGTVPVVISGDVDSGDSLATISLSTTLPYGVANGNYFIAVDIDSSSEVEEQEGLPTVAIPDVIREDGEGNNQVFTSSAEFTVTGISLNEALDDAAIVSLDLITTDGEGIWFGRTDAGDISTSEDDQVFSDADGAQTPELNQGESASFSLTIANTSIVSFDWGIDGGSDLNELQLFLNGVEVSSISGDEALATIDPAILVPDNSTLTWKYVKGAATTGDSAYVDNIALSSNTLPDLVLTNIDYTPGTYVLGVGSIIGAPEQKVGTSVLDITVEAENQGEDLTSAGVVFTAADLEVRLSTDRTYGNEDDIVLGSFSQVEGSLESGELLRFIGGLPLGDNIPEGNYYLIAKVDSNDRVAEFSDSNNIFITENRDVVIEALPRLRPYDTSAAGITPSDSQFYTDVMEYDEAKLYTPGSTMQVALSIHNNGLDDLIDDETGELQTFVNEVYLVAIDREELDDYINDPDFSTFTINDFEGEIGDSLLIDDFSVTADLKGLRDGFPDGDFVNINLELTLPNLNNIESINGDKGVSDFVYFLRLIIDSTDEITETGSLNVWNNVNFLEIDTAGFDPISLAPFVDFADDGLFSIIAVVAGDFDTWADFYYGVGLGNRNVGTAGGQENLLAYAFNRNPGNGDTAGNQFPGSYGFDQIDGDNYLSITFDFQYRVSDLVYTIEATDSLGVAWTPVATINTLPIPVLNPDGGYTQGAGVFSLTGDGGLISEPNIISIVDFGAYARITVIDDVSSDGPSARFMRVVVDTTETTDVPD